MAKTILFVDDEPNILAAFRRQMHQKYEVLTANNGKEALALLSSSDPIPVIVSDLRMPIMDGIQFFTIAKEISPDSVRILLTGHADLNTAIDAINQGKIFQFLTKPCPQPTLLEAIQIGLDHYEVAMNERNLLDQTHQISLRLLTEFLSLANPIAYTRAIRIRRVVNQIVTNLKPMNAWQYQLAAMLSQLGCIVIPQNLLEKVYLGDILSPRETRIIASHPMVGAKLLENISQLGSVAVMVRDQNRNFSSYSSGLDEKQTMEECIGAQILKIAVDYDKLIQKGMKHSEVINFMDGLGQIYNPQIVSNLGSDEILIDNWDFKLIDNEEVELGMVINQDIFTKSNILLVPKNQVVDSAVYEKIQKYAQGIGIVEPFRVLVRSAQSNNMS